MSVKTTYNIARKVALTVLHNQINEINNGILGDLLDLLPNSEFCKYVVYTEPKELEESNSEHKIGTEGHFDAT